MTMANLAQIYDWFMTGKKPTQPQFWASWGSFWNKEESIPQSAISNLSNTLNAKAEKTQFDAHKTAGDAHQALFDLKQSLTDKGSQGGYAPLDEFTKLAAEYLNIVDDLVTGGSDALASADTVKTLKGQIDAINLILTSDDINLDTVQELVNAIKEVETSLETILVNDLTTGGTTKALTAEMGKSLKALIDALYSNETIDTLLNGKSDKILSLKTIIGTAYSLIADDSLVELVYEGTAPMTVTIPNNSTVALPIGTVFYTVATNTGVLSIAGAAGVTFQTAVALSGSQNEVRKYTKRATNVWGIEGNVVSSADMILSAAQTVTETKTFLSGKFGLRNVANTFTSFFTNTNTASRTYTLQDRNGTLADLTDVNAKMANPTGGIASYLPKFLTATTMGLSRLWDTGTKFGIGTTKTPTEDITFGNQGNRTIGVEQSSNTNNGRDMTVFAGRTINFVEGAGFQPLSTGLSGSFTGAVIEPVSQDVYVNLNGSIHKRPAGSGPFIYDGAGGSRGMGYDLDGNIYSANATGGYRKKLAGGSTWTQINPAGVTGNGSCFACNSLGDLYFGTSTGLWKQTGGTGSFVLVWSGNAEQISISPIDDSIYLFDYTAGILYKQTEGTGSFLNVWTVALARGLCCALDGNVYVLNGLNLFRQIAGTGSFTSMGASLPNGSWGTGLAVDANSSLYGVSTNGSDVYFIDNNAPGTPDLDGGTFKVKAGTGKGTGKSRIQFITGQKTASGTNMQAEAVHGEIDENGALVWLTNHEYADNATALAAGLRVGSLYWDSSGNVKRVI